MDREERLLAWLGSILIILSLLVQILDWSGFTPSFFAPYSLIVVLGFAGAGLIAIIIFVIAWKRSKSVIRDPRFARLTIYYSHKDDTPDTPNPSHPRFVIYKTQAYWVSDLIEPYIKQGKIYSWHSFDGEKKLRKNLKDQGISVNEKDPSDEELGLWLTPYGTLVLANNPLDAEMLHKFNDGKSEGKFKVTKLPSFSHGILGFHVIWRNKHSHLTKGF